MSREKLCKDCIKEKQCNRLADRLVGLRIFFDCVTYNNYRRKRWKFWRPK